MNHIKAFAIYEAAYNNESTKSELEKLFAKKIEILERGKKVTRFKPSPSEKRIISEVNKANTVLDRQIESYIYHESEVRSALKAVGIPAQKSTSTSIRGYRNYSTGFSIDSDDKSRIDIKGYADKIDELSKMLADKGIENRVSDGSIHLTPDKELSALQKKFRNEL